MFLTCHFKKTLKTRFLNFEKNVKYVFSNNVSKPDGTNYAKQKNTYTNYNDNVTKQIHAEKIAVS